MSDSILIIDHELAQRKSKEQLIKSRLGYDVYAVDIKLNPLKESFSSFTTPPKLALIDIGGDVESIVALVQEIKSLQLNTSILVMLPYGRQSIINRLTQVDVDDFLEKPVTAERLQWSLRQMIKVARMQNYTRWLEHKISGYVSVGDIIGNHPLHKTAIRESIRAAANTAPVWIEGESGTGKELLARVIHGSSDRAGKPFVVMNCDMLPEHVAESMLFGQDKALEPINTHFVLGKIREAEGGTLLIKEADALNPMLQQKLLHFIDQSLFTTSGSVVPMRGNVRIICSSKYTVGTPSALRTLLQQRASCLVIHMPTLEQRLDDIAVLAEHFTAMYSASENKYIQCISKQALHWLSQCQWPDNVRQLAGVIWRAVMLCDDTVLDLKPVQLAYKNKPIYLSDMPSGIASAPAQGWIDERGNVKTLRVVEEEAIRYALVHTKGCMTRAAKQLGIGRSTLYRKVSELSIEGYISRANQTTLPTTNVSSANRS
ncbi:MAG: sigma 54-interacting transcriptional regulator [Rickettsiales bacterium]|nr:sigma 54-interacting transcriptional regulator [Rickettsiales bacterium]